MALYPIRERYIGDIHDDLREGRYERYSASPYPLSSAWDRVCEFYAQLTGVALDYGAGHSAQNH